MVAAHRYPLPQHHGSETIARLGMRVVQKMANIKLSPKSSPVRWHAKGLLVLKRRQLVEALMIFPLS